MKHDRLHGLTDGIFAIAMTLLVLNLRVPIVSHFNNHLLLSSLRELIPEFLSFVLSFAILFIYWRAHNFVVSNLARSINVTLTNLNALFLLLIVLIPFSAEFLGRYHNSEIAILLYGINVLAISTTLIFMRNYIIKSDSIEANPDWTESEHLNAFIRMAVPSLSAILAIIVGLLNKNAALAIFVIAVIFSFSSTSISLLRKIIRKNV